MFRHQVPCVFYELAIAEHIEKCLLEYQPRKQPIKHNMEDQQFQQSYAYPNKTLKSCTTARYVKDFIGTI